MHHHAILRWLAKEQRSHACGDAGCLASLPARFASATDVVEVWTLADHLRDAGGLSALPHLLRGLSDSNPFRQNASAFQLRNFAGRKVVRRLISVLLDSSRSPQVRGTAAESLGELRRFLAVPALLCALHDPEPKVRFWCLFALSHFRNPPPPFPSRHEIITQIESLLDDSTPVPGEWTVGQEALGILSWLNPPGKPYRDLAKQKCREILDSGVSQGPDWLWAGMYNR
jgi:hypothetical protein